MDCWQQLGIEPTQDKRAIKRAYAKLIKQNNPEDNPEAFQAIRDAYEHALMMADYIGYDDDSEAEAENQLIVNFRPADSDSRSEADYFQPGTTQPAQIDASGSEKQKVLAAQIDTIEDALQALLPLVESDEAAAIEYCKSKLTEEYFLALDVRYEFEGRLIVGLLRNLSFKLQFARYLADEFHWDIDLRRSGPPIINHFEADGRYAGAFYNYAYSYVVELVKLNMEKFLHVHSSENSSNTYRRMAELLYVEGREQALAEFCSSKAHRNLVRSVYGYLERKGYSPYYYSPIPAATAQFLLDKKIVEPPSKNETGSRRQHYQQPQRGKVSPWLIWVLIFIGVRGIIALSNSFDSPSHSPPLGPLPEPISEIERPSEQVRQARGNAEAGDARAQYWLGLSYLRGTNTLTRDKDLAVKWLTLSAEQGFAQAQEFLGYLYLSGRDVARDDEQAVKWLSRAVDQGQANAMVWLSFAYESGQGVEKDLQRANELLQKSVALNSPEGLRVSGSKLLYGTGVEKDAEKGLELLQRSSDGGNIGATYQLAAEYFTGTNLPLSYGKATTLLDSIADKDVPIAQFWLSELYRRGLGTMENQTRARQLLNSAKTIATEEDINNFSWQLVILPNRELRNGPLAVELMTQLLSDEVNISPATLDTLAAAYAESGDFFNAAQTQQRAIDRLPENAPASYRKPLEDRLYAYKHGQTFTE